MKAFPNHLRHSSGGTLKRDATRLLLSFRESCERNDIGAALERLGISLEGNELEETSALAPGVNHDDRHFWVTASDNESIDDAKATGIREELGDRLDWVGPVYRLDEIEGREGLMCPLPNVLLVKVNQELLPSTDTLVEGLLEPAIDRGVLEEVAVKSGYLGDFRYCQITDNRYSAYELRQQLLGNNELPFVDAIHFEHMPLETPYAVVPNDTLFTNQWNMRAIHAGGTGRTGWDISFGDRHITVAIIDTGCDRNHPDLQGQFSDPGVRLDTMQPTGDPAAVPTFVKAHGTLCAGVVAARWDNSEGVAGMASECRILPLAFRRATDVQLAAGINYAADHGARVISMSFGNPVFTATVVNNAIEHAYSKGVVLCAATGNYGGAIAAPAKHPRVIACGACDNNGRRAMWSADPSTGAARSSAFGPEMSVVAPGTDIPTTDLRGSAGEGPGNYITTFFGTSAATPHVAGLAALILSVNRGLSSAEVRDIIERTADKTGPDPYSEVVGLIGSLSGPHIHKTWNRFLGYGRINVLRALQSVPAPTKASAILKSEIKEAKAEVKEGPEGHVTILPNPKIAELSVLPILVDAPMADPLSMIQELTQRIDELEEIVLGRTFIRSEDRPDMGAALLEEEPDASPQDIAPHGAEEE